ncbi:MULTISPECIES: condensation domain-containing protein [unclassified Rhizobium]|uniref:condensation domain-containing protein n=1 Tax=unclassified Rhizobium TaxID=2613769 RepID=UPI0016217DB6|nr:MULTISPECIES: condensation domain-containing protein [unclassified Rhizobium]MBB3543044.1 hypothetical protein [Rhizobium sp. BK399]MCS3742261.1 hypothetical protein [Rhizobium sp. BK661]
MYQQVSHPHSGPQDATLLRPLGPVEQYFWLSDQNSPKHFCMTLHVSGSTTVQCWREALEAVRLRHPLLRATIDRDEFGMPSFYQLEGYQIPLKVIEAEPPHDWQNAVSNELMEPFPQIAAPLTRAMLFHSAGHTTLVFTAHHAVADGMSIAFVLRDLLEVIGGGELSKLHLPPAQEEIAAAWHVDVADADPPSISSSAHMLNRHQGRPKVSGLRLSHDLSTKIRTTARTWGTTVHGALLSAIILAGRKLSSRWSDTAVRAVSPVNLRSTLGIADDCVVSIVFPIGAYAPASESGLWDLAKTIRYDLAPMKSREAIVEAFGAFQSIADLSPSVAELAAIELQACACEMMLSNLGEAPLADVYGQVRVEALWGPSVFVGIEGEQMVGAATVRGQIHLLHASFTPIPDLLETVEEMLRHAVV